MTTGAKGRLKIGWKETASPWHTAGSPLAYHPMPETACKLDDRPKASPVKTGRWDPVTGTVVFEDGSTERSSITGPAITVTAKKAAKQTLTPSAEPKRVRLKDAKPPKPPKSPKALKPAPKPVFRMDIKNDPRRARVLELRQAGTPISKIGRLVQMDDLHVKAMCLDAGLPLRYPRTVKTKPEREAVGVNPVEREKAEPMRQALSQRERRARIIAMREAGASKYAIAAELHMRQETVKAVCDEAGFGKILPDYGSWCRGSKHPFAKLTEDDVRAIRKSTETGVALAKRYGVGSPMISKIRNRIYWTHVPDEPEGGAAD